MKLPHALQIYSTIMFREEMCAVAFFKVVQQQTTGEVGKSIIFYGEIISICNSERIIKIGLYWRLDIPSPTHT